MTGQISRYDAIFEERVEFCSSPEHGLPVGVPMWSFQASVVNLSSGEADGVIEMADRIVL